MYKLVDGLARRLRLAQEAVALDSQHAQFRRHARDLPLGGGVMIHRMAVVHDQGAQKLAARAHRSEQPSAAPEGLRESIECRLRQVNRHDIIFHRQARQERRV